MENNNRCEGFINDEEDKYESEDRKVEYNNNVNDQKEYDDNKTNKMDIEKEIKANSDERMSYGEGTMKK